MAIGYGAGLLGVALWRYLELPQPHGRAGRLLKAAITVGCLGAAACFLWQASYWQNSIRALMELEPVDSSRPLAVGSIATVVFLMLLGFARLLRFVHSVSYRRFGRVVPRKIANALQTRVVAGLEVLADITRSSAGHHE